MGRICAEFGRLCQSPAAPAVLEFPRPCCYQKQQNCCFIDFGGLSLRFDSFCHFTNTVQCNHIQIQTIISQLLFFAGCWLQHAEVPSFHRHIHCVTRLPRWDMKWQTTRRFAWSCGMNNYVYELWWTKKCQGSSQKGEESWWADVQAHAMKSKRAPERRKKRAEWSHYIVTIQVFWAIASKLPVNHLEHISAISLVFFETNEMPTQIFTIYIYCIYIHMYIIILYTHVYTIYYIYIYICT